MTKAPDAKTGRIESALGTARDTASDALDGARERVKTAGKAMESNPMAVVAGGIALGVIAGALLPRTRREIELLGPVGKRVKDVAAGAAGAARAAATAELASLPLTRDSAREQVGKLIDQVSKALSSAGQAALTHAEEARPAPKPVKSSTKKAK